MSKLSAIIYFFLVLVTYPLWADNKETKPMPKQEAPVTGFAPVVEVDDLVKADIADIKKDCPTCTTFTSAGFILVPGGDHQETAVVYVWHPGKDIFFIRTRHLIYNVVFVFLPNGTKDSELKKFLAHPLEEK